MKAITQSQQELLIRVFEDMEGISSKAVVYGSDLRALFSKGFVQLIAGRWYPTFRGSEVAAWLKCQNCRIVQQL